MGDDAPTGEDEPPRDMDLTNEKSVDPDFVITLEPHEPGQPAAGFFDGAP